MQSVESNGKTPLEPLIQESTTDLVDSRASLIPNQQLPELSPQLQPHLQRVSYSSTDNGPDTVTIQSNNQVSAMEANNGVGYQRNKVTFNHHLC